MLISWKERQCASSVRLRRTYKYIVSFFSNNCIVQKSHLICAIALKYLLLTGEMGVCIFKQSICLGISVAFIIQISSTAMGEAAL